MRVPSEFADIIDGQPMDFLHRLLGVLARTEAIMADDAHALRQHIDSTGQVWERRCDLCQQDIPHETIRAMLNMTQAVVHRRETEWQFERDD